MHGLVPTRTIPIGRTPSGAERLLGFVEASHGRCVLVLLLLSLACFLPGFVSLHPMDRDEPRFAQASKQMVETGDYVDIRFQGEPRYKKPIGIHWLQAATVRAAEALGVPEARTTIALYRVPSLLGALGAVLLTYWAALAFTGRREAFLAAALMGASLILSVEARLAKTDATLLACSVAAMGALARIWLARDAARQPAATLAIFWVAVAVGVLIKGPMILMFTGLAAGTLAIRERSARWLAALRPWLGLALVLLAVLPWFGAIAWRSGGEFYRLAVGDDMLGKVATGQQNHGAPPGFYLVAFFATFWPGAILASASTPFAWRFRGEDRVAFLLAWVVPSWIVFEAVPTKLPHYVMPLYPALAILAVLAIARGFVGPDRRGAKLGFGALPLVSIGLAGVVGGAAWFYDGAIPMPALLLMAAAVALGLAAWLVFLRGEVTRAVLVGIAGAVVMNAAVFGLAQPVLQSLKLSPRLASLVRTAPCPDPAVATLGYREPSLVFLAGTGLDLVEKPAEAAAFLRGPGCRVAIVDDRFTSDLRDALLTAGETHLQLLGRVRGFNINGGRRVDIGVYRVPR